MDDTPKRKTEKEHNNKLFTMVKKIAKENKKLPATVAKIGKIKGSTSLAMTPIQTDQLEINDLK